MQVLRLDLLVPIVFILAAIFYALLGLYAWRKRPAIAVVPFAWVMLCVSVWSLVYGLEILLPTLFEKQIAVNIEYIGIVCMPVYLFFFALDFTGRSHILTPKIRAVVWFIPVLALILIWTNPWHHLMWDMESIIQVGELRLFNARFGTLFWLHTAFSYGFFAISGLMLIMEFLQRPGVYRVQISFVILALLFSFFGTILFLTGFSPIPNIDFTPLFLIPTAIGLAWVTLQYRLVEILSLEHINVLKNMKDSVIVLNDNNRVLYINPVTEQLFNKTEDQVIGQPFEQVAGVFAQKLHLHTTQQDHHTEINVDVENETKTYEVNVSIITSDQRNSRDRIIALHDVSERKTKEAELRRRGSIMSAISLAAEQFLKSDDWEKNIPDVLKSLGQAANVSRVFVMVNSFDDHQVIHSSLKYEWTAAEIQAQIGNPALQNIALEKAGLGRWVDTLTQGYSIYGSIKEFPEPERDFFHPLGSRSIATVPIFVEAQWWAFLIFDECRTEPQWTATELDAFQTAASIFGAAEARARTARKLFQRQLSMGLLQEIVAVALQAETMIEMAETVTDRLAGLIKADGCFLTLWEDTTRRTIPIAAYGELRKNYPALSIEPGETTFTKSALELERTLVIEDTTTTPYASQRITATFPSKSIIVLPLVAKTKKLGALLVSFDEPHRFDTEETQICEQAAALIALALEKFQAMDDAKRRADTSEALRRAGMAITEKLELDDTIEHILEQLQQVVPYDSASVQLIEERDLIIVGGRGWSDPKQVIGIRFPIQGDNPNQVVIETGQPYYLPEAETTYEAFRTPPHDHIKSWLGVPLIAQNKIIGLLAIDSEEPADFSPEDIKIAMEFANQVSISLENARLFQETQTQAITDELTGIFNRRGLFQEGQFEFQRARRINRPFTVMMFDIDHFKKVNDQYGHPAGDQLLRHFAQRCLTASRATDLVGRYGGEEFVLLLSETNLEAARLIGERLRQFIMNTPFETDAGEISITSSIGIAEAGKQDTLETLIERADTALYKAKKLGRNQVVIDDSTLGG